MNLKTPLWSPDKKQLEQANLTRFIKYVEESTGKKITDYETLYQWSIDEKESFWSLLWDFCEIIGHKGDLVLVNGDDIEKATWFPDATLNFAQNLLRERSDNTAITFKAEDQLEYQLSFNELYGQVAAVAAWLKKQGVVKGDRVAAYLPNMPETIVTMLATTSLGAIWTSTSPDFGEESVIDRFGQTQPKILFTTDGYFYNGKTIDIRNKVEMIKQGLPTLLQTVEIPLANCAGESSGVSWKSILDEDHEEEINFVQTDFNHPLYILYSSGTTGKPKCITHKVGGVLLQHLKEHRLHSDIKQGDRVFYFTTCGWMMWNWLVTALASRATVVLFDGAPFYPDGNVLWDYAEKVDMTLLGTSAKYIDALRKNDIKPVETHHLNSLRTICSTGSVLAPESFDFVYESIKKDVNLASISGGTDIVSCFVLGNPVLPVFRGESQCRGLGMAVEVFNSDGVAVTDEKGELVCSQTFPSQPLCFWGDDSGDKYHDAYFSVFNNVWHHGDYVRLTINGGIVIYGRSDATLNPGGVRIGTAEIYRHVEQLDDVVESIVIGQEWNNDVRVVLFVVLKPGVDLDEQLIALIRKTVREKCTPRHMPAKVIQVAEIPRTKSGKIVELAVRDVVHNREIKNRGALANPQALELYKNIPELQ
ncbi:MAG: acetoacetate--CoA ligase [Gammaproteobacteria bacterium]|jgi:acetoacetyl-CoA synthetase|nr:acetoacetate--CoA ligase [Gammaproteobacteria bacterium]MBT3725540.1 acetoacetate--CoA ligase [Gammaproteobacteria bacterium]MBT4075108.1 acetoacetate--CoA ligase [Gammaproteobacteria bacterium]MBT4194582.1 acetoacetate--CoA ligase [Gammaproteobacteria bacterium]MBT4448856.1 acetoacetate--CoA ligase [Gammaproteobacteria bacterium]